MRADDDHREDSGSDRPEEIFCALRGRDTPELDSEAAWRRLRVALPERAPASGLAGWLPGWRTDWRIAAAAATVVLAVSLVLWQGWGGVPPAADAGPEPADGVASGAIADVEGPGDPAATIEEPADGDRSLVLLADAVPADEAPAADAATDGLTDSPIDTPTDGPPGATPDAAPGATLPMRLDVRLLREGIDHDPALGAGGADPTADIGATLRAVLPEREYGILGRWQGVLGDGAMETELAPGYRLAFEVDPDDPRTLRRVRLSGDRGPLVADEIRLEPGQVYLFGVRDADGATADVLLAIRLRDGTPHPGR